MSGTKKAAGPTRSKAEAVEKGKEINIPAPTATGNHQIIILKHELSLTDPAEEIPTPAGVELALRNVSDSRLATAVFEAVFYDGAGAIVGIVKHRELEWETETSRAIRINSSVPIADAGQVKSYAVRVVRTTTAEVERVQLRRHQVRTNENGAEEVWGIVKNIGDVKTDAAVVWTFYGAQKENIGTRVVVLRDIEPATIREYELNFKPQAGDTVQTYSLAVGEIAPQGTECKGPAHVGHVHGGCGCRH